MQTKSNKNYETATFITKLLININIIKNLSKESIGSDMKIIAKTDAYK
ncbi:hypothetical protein [Flavobacterium sp.]|nr:hypothetical protein [Flavobacterium sp.]